jgi:diguanylate cyclase (GGDEF)-like protein
MSRSPRLMLEPVANHQSSEITERRPGFAPDIHARAAALEDEIDALKDQNRKLRHIVYTDPLTGLFNRRALEHALVPRWSERECGAVIVLDLDRFKNVNDEHGHKAGDAVLEAFGSLIRANIRAGDQAARYGGEEFVILVQGALARDAEIVADRIRAATERYLFPGGIRMTVSAGIAAGLPPDWPRLFKAADAALYEAKRAGRNRSSTSRTSSRAPVDDARESATTPRALPKRVYWSPAMPGPAPDFVARTLKH